MNFVTVSDAIVLHYRVDGPADGKPLVLVNSLGTDLRIWEVVTTILSQRYRVISYDKRGHGLSTAPAAPYAMTDHVGDLVALLDRLQVESFALAGVSVGGLIAQALALDRPARVRALAVSNSAARIGTDASWNDRIALVKTSGMAAIGQGVVERWFGPDFRASYPEQVAGWRNLLERTPVEGYAGTCAVLRDTDLTARVGEIGLRTLFIAGSEDLATPPELVRATSSLYRDADYRLIAGVGHLPSIEQPRMVADLLQNYLQEVGYV